MQGSDTVNQTYNPILETVDLRRVRLSAVRPPALGTALVLERPADTPVVVLPGKRVPNARTGNYSRLFRIDVATRGLSFTSTVPSDNTAFPFSVEVTFACQVTDPAVIARDNFQDMTGALAPPLTSIVRRVASYFNALNTSQAEAAITSELMATHSAPAVRLSGFAVRVTAVDAGHLISVARETVVGRMRHDAMKSVVDGGRDDLLAHTMAMNGGDPTPWLDREQDARDKRTNASLQALRALMGSSEQLEGFDKTEIAQHTLGTFFTNGSPITPKGGIRDRIERKRLGAGDGGPIVEGNPVDTSTGIPLADTHPTSGDGAAQQPAAEPTEGGRRSSRLRGTARGGSHTKDDD
jgi:hypothetical protein